MSFVLKINGEPVETAYSVCQKISDFKQACDAMTGDQLQMYIDLKVEMLKAGAAAHAHHDTPNLLATGFHATKFLAARAFEGAQVVGHVLAWTHAAIAIQP